MPSPGLLYGLGAAIGWGLVDVVASVVGRRAAPLALALVAQGTGLVLFVVAFALSGFGVRSTESLPGAVLFGVIAAIGYVTAFAALRIGPLAVVSPVIAAYGGLSVVLAVLFRGEALSGLQWLGVVAAVTGIVLVALVLDGGRRPRLVGVGVAFAFVSNLGYALATVGLAGPTQEMGWLPAMVVSRAANVASIVAAVLVALALARWRVPPAKPAADGDGDVGSGLSSVAVSERSRRLVAGLLLVGAFDALATTSFSIGLERAETWLVGLTSSFGPALAVLFAVAVLRERLRPVQWLGLGLLASSVVVLGLPI